MEISNEDKQRKIVDYLKKNSGKCFGAYKIDMALGFDPGGTATGNHKSWDTHKVLQTLSKSHELKQGIIRQCPNDTGFCFISNEKSYSVRYNESKIRNALTQIMEHDKHLFSTADFRNLEIRLLKMELAIAELQNNHYILINKGLKKGSVNDETEKL